MGNERESMWKLKMFERITTIVSSMITILTWLYGIICGLISRVASISNPYIDMAVKWLMEHRDLILVFFTVETCILVTKCMVLAVCEYRVRRYNPIFTIRYPIVESMLLVIVMNIYIFFEPTIDSNTVDPSSTREETEAGEGQAATAEHRGDTSPKTDLDEDEIMQNIIYEMTLDTLGGGTVDMDYDTKYVRERVVVDYYVVESTHKVFSVEEWKECSDEELYHIRNGIFAFCGCRFDSGYYDMFVWYKGNIDLKKFDWKTFNPNQHKNIMNICYTETQRKNRQVE